MVSMSDSTNREFVIQKHTTPAGAHWDLMLEHERVLWTWRINSSPDQIGNAPLEAERIADHALKFLSYEGPVQNATGTVQIADKGALHLQSIKTDQITCQLDGTILKGLFTLSYKRGSFWDFQRH